MVIITNTTSLVLAKAQPNNYYHIMEAYFNGFKQQITINVAHETTKAIRLAKDVRFKTSATTPATIMHPKELKSNLARQH